MKLFGEYEDKKLGPEYLELVTDLRTLVNYGKYSSQVISNSPDWEGKEGETLFRYQANGTGWFYYNYFWVNSGWSFLRWVGSSNALVPDAGSITTDMIQTGAVTENELGNASVTISKLKTATSEVSTTNTDLVDRTLTGGSYCFYPQIKMSTANADTRDAKILVRANQAGWTSYVTNISLAAFNSTIYAQARYVTASGEDYWLWLLIDKTTKDIISMSGAPDHVAYGNGGDFDKVPHPFRNYNPDTQDIILIEKSQAKSIQQEAKEKGLSVLELVDRDYKIDFSQTYPYEPIHSGQFSPDEKPVLVKSIPDYIQVRKLAKK